MKIAVLFPGQGSQYLGMGMAFAEKDAACAALLQKAEEISGQPLAQLIADGPMEKLTENAVLQPAVTAVNLICWEMTKRLLPIADIHCFAGHSLGEYSALCAAGALSLDDAFRLVSKRGQLMEREGRANPGSMRAALGLPLAKIEEIIAAYHGGGVVCAANHNTAEQIVISGDFAALDAVGEAISQAGGKVIALNVSCANHSPLLAGAVPEFAKALAAATFRQSIIPVYLNVTAAPESKPQAIRAIMERQIVSMVRWKDSIEAMLTASVDTFIEVGPKTVLKGMMKKLIPKSQKVTVLQVDSPETLVACRDLTA
ncbi:MAG: ACP S-malonyltransferase [Desulfobulbaceae bacterium]|jgi:[acyl-carrier-protein] S-malonyltransferase|nr:ACP S-malonyltransferase [Desulfobulbaceae bacterium]